MTALTDPRLVNRRARSRWRSVAWLAVPIVLLGLAASCETSEAIDRLTVVNRTEFDFEVQVSDAKKESWQILGGAEHESSTVNELIADEGPIWVFQFRYGGELIDELTVKRADLERNRWRVEVPSRIAERMRRLGFEPPPDR
jgi:hypothetical protein